MARRKRNRKRGTGLSVLILLLTSVIMGLALWTLRQVTLQNVPGGVDGPESTAAPHSHEEIRPSERERLDALLRQTERQDKSGAPAD